MSFHSYLEQLKAKPEHVRRRIAFWTSLCITAIIAAFWLASFTVRLIDSQSGKITFTEHNGPTPAQSIMASVGSFFVDIKDMVFGSSKVEYASIEVRAGER